MSASALLAILRALGAVRSRLTALTALWRQFPAHKCPRADQKGGADYRRRGERGEILHHASHSTRRQLTAERRAVPARG